MAMKVFQVGAVLGAADLNEYCVNTRFASKPGDTSRTSNTTLANDPDLQVVADASKTYEMMVFLLWHGPTAGGFKADITAPSAYSWTGSLFYPTNSGGTTFAMNSLGGASLGGSGGFHFSALDGGAAFSARFDGILVTAANGGNVTVRWSQDSSSGTSTVLQAGSYIRLRRLS